MRETILILDRYNPKYHLPILQIETNQVNAKYLEKLAIEIPYRFRTSEKHKVLIDSTEVEIRAVAERNLSIRIYNLAALEHLQNGDSLKIKIRTEDYEKYLKTRKFEKRLRFYELEANGEILYQKRGLK